MVVTNNKDWYHYGNSTKLMIMNYWKIRNSSKCVSCKEDAKRRRKIRKKEEALEGSSSRLDEKKQPKKKAIRASHDPN